MKRSVIRRGVGAVAIGLAGILLAGCVDLGIESQFNEDGSARQTVIAAIDKTALGQLDQFGGGSTELTDTDAAQKLAEERGLEYEAIDNADQIGAKFSKTFADGEDVGATITELYNDARPADSEPIPPTAFVGTFTRDEDAGTWTFELTIDSDEILATSGGDAGGEFGAGMLDQIFDFTYTATFPGEVSESTGTNLSDTKVQWSLPVSGTTTLTASGKLSGGGSDISPWLIGLIIAGFLLVPILIGGYFLVTRTKKTPPKAEPAPAAAPAVDADPQPSDTVEPSPASPDAAPIAEAGPMSSTALDPSPTSEDAAPKADPGAETAHIPPASPDEG